MVKFGTFMRASAPMGMLLLIGTAWYLFAQNRILRERVSAVMASRVYPYPQTAFRLPLEVATSSMITAPDRRLTSARRRLILVSSDTCRISEDNLANWRSLLSKLAHPKEVDISFVSFEQGRLTRGIVEFAERLGFSYEERRVSDTLKFTLETGIVAVPTTLLAEPDGIVLLVHAGPLLREPLGVFLNEIDGARSAVQGEAGSNVTKAALGTTHLDLLRAPGQLLRPVTLSEYVRNRL